MDTDDTWNDLFGGSMESVMRKIENMFSDLGNIREDGVGTYGYAVYQDSDGNRRMREFGNPAGGWGTPCGERLMTATLEGSIVRAVIELPGASKEDIVLEGAKNMLSVNADTDRGKFSVALALPCDVDPGSAKAEYNNGILEVTLTPMVPSDPKE